MWDLAQLISYPNNCTLFIVFELFSDKKNQSALPYTFIYFSNDVRFRNLKYQRTEQNLQRKIYLAEYQEMLLTKYVSNTQQVQYAIAPSFWSNILQFNDHNFKVIF